MPDKIDLLLPIQVPRSLTTSLADFKTLFRDGDAMSAQIAYDMAVITRDTSFASSFAKFELTGESMLKSASGTRGRRRVYR